MFDIGFSELLVIAVVGLIVLGPERLPRAASYAGLWIRRLRAQWHSVRTEFESELADADMRRSIQRAQEELREAQVEMQRSGERLRAQLQEAEAKLMQVDADAAGKSDIPVITPPPLGTPDSGREPDDRG